MTVCIATIYGKNQGVIAVADKMFTSAPGIITVHEVNENNKITKLSETAIVMMAGNVTNASSIISELTGQVQDGEKLSDIAAKAAAIYQQHYRNAVNTELSRWALDLETFNNSQKNLDPTLVNNLNNLIGGASLEVEMIITGHDSNGPGLYVVTNPGVVNCLDSIGRAIIGSGAAHASLSLVDGESQKSDDFGKALFKSFKAKKRAEYDPNVGKYTSVCIVTDKVKEFNDNEIKSLKKLYDSAEKEISVTISSISVKVGEEFNGVTNS